MQPAEWTKVDQVLYAVNSPTYLTPQKHALSVTTAIQILHNNVNSVQGKKRCYTLIIAYTCECVNIR